MPYSSSRDCLGHLIAFANLALGLAVVCASGGSAQEYQTDQEKTDVVLAPDAFSPYAGRNLWRAVSNQTRPFSQYDSKNPEDLSAFPAEYEERTGGEVLAIPHNGNLSNGRMFSLNAYDGSELTKDIASLRVRFEPLYEATQIKGDGEAHPFLSPNFLVAALKDPISGNLDRIQIVKGWVDANGETQEKVYNVTWSGDRQLDANGKLPDVGNTVDVARATWTYTIGAAELIGVWEDPDFDPALRAFYYARVIEIPTPRWTAYES